MKLRYLVTAILMCCVLVSCTSDTKVEESENIKVVQTDITTGATICRRSIHDVYEQEDEPAQIEYVYNDAADLVICDTPVCLLDNISGLLEAGWYLPLEPYNVDLNQEIKLTMLHPDYLGAALSISIQNTDASLTDYKEFAITEIVIHTHQDKIPATCGGLCLGKQLEPSNLKDGVNTLVTTEDGIITALGVRVLPEAPTGNLQLGDEASLRLGSKKLFASTTIDTLSQMGWNINETDVGTTTLLEDSSDAVITVKQNGNANQLNLKERNVCLDVYCYGVTFDSKLEDIISKCGVPTFALTAGNSTYILYDDNGKALMFKLTGTTVNEVTLIGYEEGFDLLQEVTYEIFNSIKQV